MSNEQLNAFAWARTAILAGMMAGYAEHWIMGVAWFVWSAYCAYRGSRMQA